ncbi:MAG: helix-turn-helix domain-containing protein, partial [Thermoanaerobaculia bacterium]
AVIRAYLPDGYPSAKTVAPLMDISVRTMARRLVDHGLNYQSVIDKVRFNLARELLQEATVTVGDVAIATGFSDSTHFARMFRRTGGLSPLEYRRSFRDSC